jgi:transcriptional regulator with XRE-family HTH domain
VRVATPDLQRLAAFIEKRRRDLNLSVVRAARASGMSRDTWSRVENGQPARLMNYDKIEDVLQWATGSCRKIMDGGEPIEAASVSDEAPVEFVAVPPEAVEEKWRQAVQGAMIAGTDLTADKIRDVTERALAEARRNGLFPEIKED